MSVITTYCGGKSGKDVVVTYNSVDYDYSVSARATIDGRVYLETAGNTVEICEENIAGPLNRVDSAAYALADLADKLIRINRRKTGRAINDMLTRHACAGVVAHFDCQRWAAKFTR